jgi:hypothetical protein
MINFENYTYILTNEQPEKFTKCIEKSNFTSITFKLLTINIREAVNIMIQECFKYCYSVEDNRFFELHDLIEIY